MRILDERVERYIHELQPPRSDVMAESLAPGVRRGLLLARSPLGMLSDPDNLLTNRESLVRQVADMADSLPPAVMDDMVNALEPLARGTIAVSADLARERATEPGRASSVFQGDFGRPEDRGRAIEL